MAKQVISDNLPAVENKLMDALIKQGITTDKIIEKANKALDIAETDKKPDIMLKWVDMMLDYSGQKPSKVTYRRTETTNSGLLDSYDKAKAEQKTTITKQISIDTNTQPADEHTNE